MCDFRRVRNDRVTDGPSRAVFCPRAVITVNRKKKKFAEKDTRRIGLPGQLAAAEVVFAAFAASRPYTRYGNKRKS